MEDQGLLIAAHELAAVLDNPNTRILDCRFDLMQPGAGRQAYLDAHIPGATYAHLDEDLAAPVSAGSGRHPLPDVAAIARFFGAQGIDADSHVVVYDGQSGAIAARAWWLLRWLGHRHVTMLDGGFAAWLALNLPVDSGMSSREPRYFTPRPDDGMVIETAEIMAAAARDRELRLVDARDAARFRGEREPIDTVAGHVPGALNLPCSANINAQGRWKSPAELRQMWSELLNAGSEQPMAVMCGSGVTACHLVLSSLLAGIPEPRVYVGSWSEWIRDPTRPVATGDG